uniref:Uncharacterized protein n=1 Tax=Bactrocera dorsalis TaxID=27457 RepID=A0A034VGK6_BACDO
MSQQQQQQQLHQHLQQSGNSEKIIRPQVLRAMNKHSVLLQELHQRQTQVATSRSTQLAAATNIQHFATGCTATLTITTSTVTANTSGAGVAATATVSAAAAAAVVSPNKVATQMTSSVGGKTATILVSKSKTKTGLPLLLKNSINN